MGTPGHAQATFHCKQRLWYLFPRFTLKTLQTLQTVAHLAHQVTAIFLRASSKGASALESWKLDSTVFSEISGHHTEMSGLTIPRGGATVLHRLQARTVQGAPANL